MEGLCQTTYDTLLPIWLSSSVLVGGFGFDKKDLAWIVSFVCPMQMATRTASSPMIISSRSLPHHFEGMEGNRFCDHVRSHSDDCVSDHARRVAYSRYFARNRRRRSFPRRFRLPHPPIRSFQISCHNNRTIS